MDFNTRFERALERDDLIKAIKAFDVEALRALIDKGADIKRLADDRSLFWYIQKNFFPEAEHIEKLSEDERKQAQNISQKLTRGNEILKTLAHGGLLIPETGENYEQYSLYALEEDMLPEEDGDLSLFVPEELIMAARFPCKRLKSPSNALWYAVSPEALKIMITQGIDVNLKDSSGWTALHHIIADKARTYFNRLEMIRILLEAGADVNAQSKLGITPLMLAFEDVNNAEIILLLIKNGANCDILDRFGHSLDFWIDDKLPPEEDLIEELLDYARKSSRLSESEIHMIVAAFSGNDKELENIIENNLNININVQIKSGYTALLYSVPRNENLIKFLLSHGANPNIQDNNGFSAIDNLLSDTLSDESIRVLKLLLDNGADVNIVNELGQTPLMICVRNSYNENINYIKAIQMLLEAGADINAKDNDGDTPLIHASRSSLENDNIIKYLLSKDADPLIVNTYGNSALDEAITIGKIKSVALLIKAGSPLNNYDNNNDDDFNFRLPATHHEMEKYGFAKVDSFDEFIKNNKTEDLLRAIDNGFSMNVSDIHDLRLPEAAANTGNVELVKACLETGEDENNNYCVDDMMITLLLESLQNYNVTALKTMLDAGADIDYIKSLGWHFVTNYIPEASNPKNKAAIDFKNKLHKGSEILSILHEADSNIPDKDNNDRKLSYTYVIKYGDPDNDLEFLPIKYDDVSKLRHAVSPRAVSEIIYSVSDINSVFESSAPEYRGKRRFKRTTREEIRRSLTPDDFIGDIDIDDEDVDENYDNESLESISREISQIFSPEDFVTREEYNDYDEENTNSEIRGKTILHLIAKNYKEYFDPAGIIFMLCFCGADVNARDFDDKKPLIKIINDPEYSSSFFDCIYEFLIASGDAYGKSFYRFLSKHNSYLDDDKFEDKVYSGGMYVTEAIFSDILRTMTSRLYGNKANMKLLIASLGKDEFKISMALLSGADVNTKTEIGYTPIMLASMFGTPETIKLLLNNGADINSKDAFGNNLIHLAIAACEVSSEQNSDNIRTMFEAGADINSCNNEGNTPLIIAIKAYSKFNGSVNTLLSLGADINQLTQEGMNALSVAIKNNNTRALKELLKAGADPKPLYS